jgi:hypothetical protein
VTENGQHSLCQDRLSRANASVECYRIRRRLVFHVPSFRHLEGRRIRVISFEFLRIEMQSNLEVVMHRSRKSCVRASAKKKSWQTITCEATKSAQPCPHFSLPFGAYTHPYTAILGSICRTHWNQLDSHYDTHGKGVVTETFAYTVEQHFLFLAASDAPAKA